MRQSLVVLFLVCGLSRGQGDDARPATSNVPRAEYPRVYSDGRVSFRLKAPNAKQVKVEGGAGLVKEPLDMTRADDGVWSIYFNTVLLATLDERDYIIRG